MAREKFTYRKPDVSGDGPLQRPAQLSSNFNGFGNCMNAQTYEEGGPAHKQPFDLFQDTHMNALRWRVAAPRKTHPTAGFAL